MKKRVWKRILVVLLVLVVIVGAAGLVLVKSAADMVHRTVFRYNAVIARPRGSSPGPCYYFFPFTTNPANPAAFSFSSILSALARTAKAPTWTRYSTSPVSALGSSAGFCV